MDFSGWISHESFVGITPRLDHDRTQPPIMLAGGREDDTEFSLVIRPAAWLSIQLTDRPTTSACRNSDGRFAANAASRARALVSSRSASGPFSLLSFCLARQD